MLMVQRAEEPQELLKGEAVVRFLPQKQQEQGGVVLLVPVDESPVGVGVVLPVDVVELI
jgi:hypothetical protein